jgi:hypothetical protein
MASACEERKSWRVGLLPWAALAIALVGGASQPGTVWGSSITERVVVDWHTGLALYGFDPVAYFTDATPSIGRPELEYAFTGAVWRFRNEGNRAAFIDHPDIYMPSFGGYDPIGLSRNVAIPGHPQFWVISEQHLYLFHDAVDRDAFTADPAKYAVAAQRTWPSAMKALSP